MMIVSKIEEFWMDEYYYWLCYNCNDFHRQDKYSKEHHCPRKEDISICPHCNCMTKTIGIKDLCGKCRKHKKEV